MTAAHFFVDPREAPVEEGLRLLLSPPDSHHALRVLRLRAGEEVSVADGRGRVGLGVFAGEAEGRAAVQVGRVGIHGRPSPQVTVAFAPPKGERLAWAIQKLAEVGVDEAVLISTERGVRSVDERGVERLRTIAREAAMQSRQPFLMDVGVAASLKSQLGDGPSMGVVFLHTRAFTPLSAALPEEVAEVRLVVGPEGGFTEAEFELARDLGATPVSLGPSILRTETAAVVGAALVLSHYGRLG